VHRALAAEGFLADSSEVAHEWLDSFGEVEDLWPTATRFSQPYRIHRFSQSGLVQVPNNGCLADYVTADQMVATYEELVAQAPSAAVLSLGFHQETAAKFLPRLRDALARIESSADEQGVCVSYKRTEEVARRTQVVTAFEVKVGDPGITHVKPLMEPMAPLEPTGADSSKVTGERDLAAARG
jgi:hypothetical protein